MELALHFSAVNKFEFVPLATAVDFEQQPGGQGVHNAHAHTVETTRHFVALAAELAASVQHGEHYFSSAFALMWARWVGVNRNTAAVVFYPATTVGLDDDVDAGTKTCHCFVNSVVDHFPDEVVQASQTRGTDVHTRAFADGVEAFQDLNVFCAVVSSGLFCRTFLFCAGHGSTSM